MVLPTPTGPKEDDRLAGGLAARDHQPGLGREGLQPVVEPGGAHRLVEERQCRQQIDGHGRLAGCRPADLVEGEPDEFLVGVLMAEHDPPPALPRLHPGRRTAAQQLAQHGVAWNIASWAVVGSLIPGESAIPP